MAGHNGNPGGAGGGNAGGNKGGSGGGSNGGETNRSKGGKGAIATVGALVLALAAAWLGIDGTDGTGDGTDGDGSGANGNNATGTDGDRNHANGNRNNGGGETTGNDGDTRLCPIDTLPPQTDDVVDRILTNQDHIYSAHDGKHFGNYEGVLPKQHGSYYREYTVDTPGLNHRGARRIVVGGGTEDDPDVWYYTDDHFESFCEIPDAED